MSSRSLWAALIGICLVGACVEHTPLGPGADVIVVHAVLNPTEPTQHVLVQRTSNGSTFGVVVSDAIVTLTTPDGTVLSGTESASGADPDGATQPRYDVVTGRLVAGAPYRLRIVLASGETVEGTTTLPAATPATDVTQWSFDRARDTLRLSWQRVDGARAYEVRVAPRDEAYFGAPSYVAFTDTSVELPGAMTARGSAVFAAGAQYDVVVSAVEANYYEYYSHDTDPFTGTTLPASLEGAYGLFGAIVPILRLNVKVGGEAGALP